MKSMSQDSFLHLQVTDQDSCVLCNQPVLKNEKCTSNSTSSWSKLKEIAKKWSEINIPANDDYYGFRNVYNKINNVERAYGVKHENCRTRFFLQVDRYEIRYGKIVTDKANQNQNEYPSVSTPCTRSSSSSVKSFARLCFICEEVRPCESNFCKQGGLGRCEKRSAADRILKATEIYIRDPDHRFNAASTRLQLILSGQSHDIFSADVYYHLSCYSLYTKIHDKNFTESYDAETENYVLNDFFTSIRLNIIRDKNAYLLTRLLSDWVQLCNERGIDSNISRTNQIKKRLEDEFPEDIGFFNCGRNVIVHCATMNPCQYSVATLKGEGLRDIDLAKGFASMVRRKLTILNEEKEIEFPYTAERLTRKLNDGPMADLYNIIYLSIKGTCSLNTHGYAKTDSPSLATKIWSLAYDWEALLTKAPNPKQVAMGMTIHRVTASKEIAQYLHKSNHSISYNDILAQNYAWEEMVVSGDGCISEICKKRPTHCSIDNNDGRQQTVTGFGTTHHTNSLLFQPALTEETYTANTPADIGVIERYHPGTKEIPPYKVKEKKTAPLFTDHIDQENHILLKKRFDRDLLWSIAGGMSDETLPLLGSWTPFNIKVTDVQLLKSVKQYLPVVPDPPDYHVLREYLEFLIHTTDHLEIQHIFTHADEAVYSKLLHIIWNHGEYFKKIVPLMGGFHQLVVMQKVINKRHSVIGYKKWFQDAEIIAAGSIDKAIEGRHYYRCMRVHKEGFDAMVQLQVEKVTTNYTKIDSILLCELGLLRENPSSAIAENIIKMDSFQSLITDITQVTGTQSQMSLAYLKDVSLLLTLVTAARESDIDLHLEAERQMLKLVFAFDHVHYARYNSYQHVLLSEEKQKNTEVYKDLKTSGPSAALTNGSFKGIHGDLMTEIFNKETKGTAGPFRSGYSTNMKTVNTWVRTTHIHTKLRNALKNKLKVMTSSKHQELTKSHMTRHAQHVMMLKATLKTYQIDLFSNSPAVSIATGEQIPSEIIADVINADSKGNVLYKKFVKERLVEGSMTIFDPIPRNNLKTGLQKQKKKKREISLLQEDCQAFGMLVDKAPSLEEAFQHPLTTIPLSIAEASDKLYSSDKSGMRNTIIRESNANFKVYPIGAGWIVDGMGCVRSLKPESTYREFFQKLLKRMLPPHTSNASQLAIIMDTYLTHSAKECTRNKRGEKGARVYITGLGQHMPQGEGWQNLLSNTDNKKDLIHLFAEYLNLEEVKKYLKIPIVITEGENTWQIEPDKSSMIYRCNHEEADSRMVLHALLSDDNDWVICSKDTDVLLLMAFAYSQESPTKEWCMMYEVGLFVNIRKIVDYLGKDLCKILPQFHALTGCDTTSYFFKVGKFRVLKKLMQNRNYANLISNLGCEKVLSENDVAGCMQFIQCVHYGGVDGEDYVKTRIRLYKRQTKKSSLTLPPDPNSCVQAILRAHHQTYQWLRLKDKLIDMIPLCQNGWALSEEGSVIPVWYTCAQFPKSMTSKLRKITKDSKDGHEADDEGPSDPPPQKRAKKGTGAKCNDKGPQIRFKDICKELQDRSYDADYDGSDEAQDSDYDEFEWEHLSDFEDSSSDSDSEWEV